jgi:hypothetical protein
MSLQYRLPGQVIDPWTLFCAECSRKMRIVMATPAQAGRETRTYECACGHSERINLAIPKLPAHQRSRSQGAEKNLSPAIVNSAAQSHLSTS